MPHRHSPDGGASSTQYLPDGVQGQMIELRKALRVRPGLMAFPDFRIPLLIICPGPGGLPPQGFFGSALGMYRVSPETYRCSSLRSLLGRMSWAFLCFLPFPPGIY